MHILNLNKKICAYSVNFENNDKTGYELTKNLKNQFNIELNQIKFTEEDFWNILPFAAKKIDEPIADYAILPTFKMASEASKNFKVALSGEGGMNFLLDMEDINLLEVHIKEHLENLVFKSKKLGL